MVPKFNNLQKHAMKRKCKKIKLILQLANISCLQSHNMPRNSNSSLLGEDTQWQIYWLGGYGGWGKTKKCAISILFSTMWIKKHLWAQKCAISFLFFSCMNAKNHLWPLAGSQVCIINCFLQLCEFLKSHMGPQLCIIISFFLFCD